MGGGSGNEDSVKFDNWLTETLSHEGDGKRLERLARWEEDSPSARQCHPREEHLAPLFVVAGAAGNDTPCSCTFSGDVLGQKVSSFAFEDAVSSSKMIL
jgi:aromatic ring-opening dioxygenase catalytic subunit (LigB family)